MAEIQEATAAMDLSDDNNGENPTEKEQVSASSAEEEAANEVDPAAPSEEKDDQEDEDPMAVDDEDTDETSVDSDKDEAVSPEEADLLLIKAAGLKEEGNAFFKEGELEKAARAYRRGVSSLKKLNKSNTAEDQVKALLVTLYTNLSTVTFKTSKFRVSADVASQAIAIESCNVKALYRRAVANRKLGDLEGSRNDLRAALAVDSNSSICKKELVSVKKELESVKENQKKALAKAFGNSGSFLYNDREALAKRKEEEEQRKKKEAQELAKKRKQEWEDESVKRLADSGEAISYEDWDKEQVAKEENEKKAKEEERKAKEAERKAAEKRRREMQKAASKKEEDDDDDDDELTEAELNTMRGYKKTSDGRITSYFTRELSEDEKKRIGDIAPKRLDHSATSQPSTEADDAAAAAASKWNQAGTWEEKDTTTWCTAQLQKRLDETSMSTETLDADIVKVDELNGHSSVAIVSGKKRYIFDYHVKLQYEIKQKDIVIAKGAVELPDICSTHHDELEVVFDAWKKRPSENLMSEATKAQRLLMDQLRANVQLFVQDFNAQY